jgi:dienelactone hydrolase
MAEIVLFHSALGLRPGVTSAADRLREAGHSVHVPNYYDGEVFDDLDDGLRKRDELGVAEILRRAREAVAGLPAGLVFAGFSLGNDPAELLAAERPGARGRCSCTAPSPSKRLASSASSAGRKACRYRSITQPRTRGWRRRKWAPWAMP